MEKLTYIVAAIVAASEGGKVHQIQKVIEANGRQRKTSLFDGCGRSMHDPPWESVQNGHSTNRIYVNEPAY